MVDAWHITPKIHVALHLPSQGRLINPRFTQCYGEESLVGRVTRIWRATANGPYSRTIQKQSLARYWTGLELRMTAEPVSDPS